MCVWRCISTVLTLGSYLTVCILLLMFRQRHTTFMASCDWIQFSSKLKRETKGWLEGVDGSVSLSVNNNFFLIFFFIGAHLHLIKKLSTGYNSADDCANRKNSRNSTWFHISICICSYRRNTEEPHGYSQDYTIMWNKNVQMLIRVRKVKLNQSARGPLVTAFQHFDFFFEFLFFNPVVY